MSFRTTMLDVADILRALTGPSTFDIRTTQITIRTRTYQGGHRSSQVAYSDSDLVLPQIYKVSKVKIAEVSASGGLYEISDLKVGPITPRGDTLGWTESQLAPIVTNDGQEIIYVLTGDAGHSGEYSRISFEREKPFSYYLVLRRHTNPPR